MPAAAEGLDIRVAALGEDRLPIGAAELAFAAARRSGVAGSADRVAREPALME